MLNFLKVVAGVAGVAGTLGLVGFAVGGWFGAVAFPAVMVYVASRS